jgi:copper(I)-binding protein
MLRKLLLPCLFLPAIALAELDISDAWIKNLPPSVPVRAGYMTLYNPDSSAVSIVAIRSVAFASVEIHQTIAQDGMMRMEKVKVLNIEAGTQVQLAPGGLHLMMIEPNQPTRPGELLEITILLDDGSEQSLQMQVKK